MFPIHVRALISLYSIDIILASLTLKLFSFLRVFSGKVSLAIYQRVHSQLSFPGFLNTIK